MYTYSYILIHVFLGYILFNIAFSHSLSDFCSGGHCSGQLLLPRRPVDGPGHGYIAGVKRHDWP